MMTDAIQVTEEADEAFLISEGLVSAGVDAVREQLSRKSLTKVCLDCGEEIGEARLKAVPYATLCIDCQQLRDKK